MSGSHSTLTRAEFTAELMQWSATIDAFEKLGQRITELHASSGAATPTIISLYDQACTWRMG
jgi:hypothetical protein